MNTKTLDVYNLLVDAGIAREKAEPLAREILTRSDVLDFTTKSDLKDLRVEIYKALAAQTVVIVGLIVAVLQIMG